jgi:hypothetical protein
MNLKIDDNGGYVQETVKRVPLQNSASVSIPAGDTGTATINIPVGPMNFIKSWTVTKGADVTISSIKLDDDDTYEIDSVTDVGARYGALLSADKSVSVSGSNAGLSAKNLEIQIDGYEISV